ncbi:Hypothetical predicted protein [Octopus vulgaris]|uniref:Uncharacterized protein n=1 Tax=Octopus vulgaris TaxID=6645 RepID=A0AA36F191_OCTVU|nr:Hypothetical predicted protein [Octopus vulgaris]
MSERRKKKYKEKNVLRKRGEKAKEKEEMKNMEKNERKGNNKEGKDVENEENEREKDYEIGKEKKKSGINVERVKETNHVWIVLKQNMAYMKKEKKLTKQSEELSSVITNMSQR